MTGSHRLIAGIGLAAVASLCSLISNPADAQQREQVQKMSPAVRRRAVEVRDLTLSVAEKSAILRAVKSPRMVSHLLVYQTFNGPVSKLDDYLADFYKEFNDQKLGGDLGSDKTPMAVVYSNPEGEKSVRIDIGYAVERKSRVRAPLAVRTLNLGRAVAHMHSGPYGKITAVHNEITKMLKAETPARANEANMGFPTVLKLMNDPSKVSSPDQIKTEVLVPVTKL